MGEPQYTQEQAHEMRMDLMAILAVAEAESSKRWGARHALNEIAKAAKRSLSNLPPLPEENGDV